jgi:hypothetical protein
MMARLLATTFLLLLTFVWGAAVARESGQGPSVGANTEARKGAVTITVESDSATAVIAALKKPDLGREEALKVAGMPGNQAMIRKVKEFGLSASTQSFVDALLASAHGLHATQDSETIFEFDSVKARAEKLQALIEKISTDPTRFKAQIEKRVAMFTPPDVTIHLEGHIIAGGPAGGFAFGEPKFFLNIGYEDEFDVAREMTTHELYHAIQGALKAEGVSSNPKAGGAGRQEQQACENELKLFSEVYNEGSAVYVEDFPHLAGNSDPLAQKTLEYRVNGARHVRESITLLELSVTGLNAINPVSYEDVYALGFYGQSIMYNIGYVMAKAIAENDGPAAFATYLRKPGYEFAIRYTKLPGYGVDAEHPKLGPATIKELERLSTGCK